MLTWNMFFIKQMSNLETAFFQRCFNVTSTLVKTISKPIGYLSCLTWNNFVWFLYFWGFFWYWKLPLWTLNELFLISCFLVYLLKLHFLTRCLYFFHNPLTTKREKSILQVFLKSLLKFDGKFLQMHKHNLFLTTQTLKNLNSIETLVEDIP